MECTFSLYAGFIDSFVDGFVNRISFWNKGREKEERLTEIFKKCKKCVALDDFPHRVFIVTNEQGQKETLEKLERHKTNGNTIIGVSGFFTLNAASIRASKVEDKAKEQIEHIILIDCSKRVHDFWMNMRKIIEKANNHLETAEETKKLLLEKKDFYYGGSPRHSSETIANGFITRLEDEISSGLSWLSNKERFQKIKDIFDRGNFTCLQVNLCEQEAMDAISETMTEKGMTLDAFYTSNVRDYAEQDGLLSSFQKSLNRIITPKAFIIDTRPTKNAYNQKNLPQQRLIRRNTSSMKECFPAIADIGKPTDGSSFAKALAGKLAASA